MAIRWDSGCMPMTNRAQDIMVGGRKTHLLLTGVIHLHMVISFSAGQYLMLASLIFLPQLVQYIMVFKYDPKLLFGITD